MCIRDRSHIAASPKVKKRKLPILLSSSHSSQFKTPLASRLNTSGTSTSPPLPSHLAMKFRNNSRVTSLHTVLPVSTPSHSNNLPATSLNGNSSTDIQPQQPTENQRSMAESSNNAFERVPESQDIYKTPINAVTPVLDSTDQDKSCLLYTSRCV